MSRIPTNEIEAYENLLISHLNMMVYQLRHMTEEQLDFTFASPAPTPRTLATHAWQWLICDRYHINEPDVTKHPRVPEPPADKDALADALAEETGNWRELIRSLTPERLEEPRLQFGEAAYPMTVRSFVCHMIQNSIYKNGQLSTIFYALGLDGTEPYTAPFPNPIYEEVLGASDPDSLPPPAPPSSE